ncbi:VG15 protein [Nocardiopsis terrae]
MSEATPTALVTEYTNTTQRLRTILLQGLAETFGGLGSWHAHDVDVFLEQALPVVSAAHGAMATLTDAYLAQLIADQLGLVPAPLGVEAIPAPRGIPVEETYRRPFVQVWAELAQGRPLSEAVQAGQVRLASIAATDLQLVRTHTTRDVLAEDERVVGYARVPKGGETCALCLIASTQTYRKKDLMPIHPGCDCGVRPLTEETGPDEDLLDAVHEAIGRDLGPDFQDYAGTDYRNFMVVQEHGELGPVLAVRGEHFTGPTDLS